MERLDVGRKIMEELLVEAKDRVIVSESKTLR